MTTIHIDRFSAGLDSLTRKQQADPRVVLGEMKRLGRFSCFEASENRTIAKTVDLLFERKLVENSGGSYPWTIVKITDLGEKFLTDGILPEHPLLQGMIRVDKRTYMSPSIAKKYGLKRY